MKKVISLLLCIVLVSGCSKQPAVKQPPTIICREMPAPIVKNKAAITEVDTSKLEAALYDGMGVASSLVLTYMIHKTFLAQSKNMYLKCVIFIPMMILNYYHVYHLAFKRFFTSSQSETPVKNDEVPANDKVDINGTAGR